MDGAMRTVQSVADEFRVTRQTVYNWISAGRIRVIQVGGVKKSVLRIEQSEIDRIKRGG